MEAQEGIRVDTHGVGEVLVLHINTRVKPTDDVRVRKAIALALDRKDFLREASPRVSGPAFTLVHTLEIPGGLGESDIRDLDLDPARDLEQARGLLAQAGYPKGFTLDLVTSEKRLYQTAYLTLKEQLSRIGIECRVELMSHRDMHRSIRELEHPKPLVIYSAWRPNADSYLTEFFHSDFIPAPGEETGTNFSSYDRIDRLIEGARLESDPRHQVLLWNQAQIRILTDMAAVPLMYMLQVFAGTTRLEYGHPLESSMALYPQFTEKTRFTRP
jgi:peptide/nickel transport system substrate-binding protein